MVFDSANSVVAQNARSVTLINSNCEERERERESESERERERESLCVCVRGCVSEMSWMFVFFLTPRALNAPMASYLSARSQMADNGAMSPSMLWLTTQ